MTDRELMQQALETLEEINKLSVGENAICLPAEIDTAMDALRERLAQPEDWQYVQKLNSFSYPRPWVGLTDEEKKARLGLTVTFIAGHCGQNPNSRRRTNDS